MSLPTHNCRNRIFRRGTVRRCNRPTHQVHCEGCSTALEEQRLRLLGISEAKKEPSNRPDDLDVEDSFEVHDDYDEDKKEPNDKQKRKSSLEDLSGEEGSSKKPYLEGRNLTEAEKWEKWTNDALGDIASRDKEEDDGNHRERARMLGAESEPGDWPETSRQEEKRERTKAAGFDLGSEGDASAPRKPMKLKSKHRRRLDKRRSALQDGSDGI